MTICKISRDLGANQEKNMHPYDWMVTHTPRANGSITVVGSYGWPKFSTVWAADFT